MKTKLFFYSAVGFFILGCKAEDALLYFFLASHLLTLSLCLYFFSHASRSQAGNETAADESD
ncbi:MAG: hypothetical protein WAM73_05705 [Desulfobacterales bacterium]